MSSDILYTAIICPICVILLIADICSHIKQVKTANEAIKRYENILKIIDKYKAEIEPQESEE